MTNFKMYGSQHSDTLAAVEGQVGFVPNVFAVLGENEQALRAFAGMNGHFAAGGLTPLEREVVQTAVSVVNECGYCVAGHTAFTSMAELDADAIEAVRNRQPIADDTLEALRRFTESVVESRGRVGRAELEAFEAAGYSRSQVFDVILGVAIKTLSNAVSGVTGIALDDAFEPFAWEAQAAATAGA
jgi:uncharacterized peroxidase-related enzyme